MWSVLEVKIFLKIFKELTGLIFWDTSNPSAVAPRPTVRIKIET